MMNSPISAPSRQSFLRRGITVAAATLRLFLRKDTYVRIVRGLDFLLSNETYTYASATAFNVMIAFFPAVIVVLTLSGKLGGPGLHGAMLEGIIGFLPANQEFFMKQIANVTVHFSAMTMVSLAILLFSAVGIFVPIELALNYVWKIQSKRHWIVSQMISFGLLFLFIAIALLPASLMWAFRSMLDFIFFFAKDSAFINWVVWTFMKITTIPFTILAFAMTYWILPARKMVIEEILPAAVFTGVCFEIGKHLYIFFLPVLNLREIYGAFAVTVTFITWALFASMMLLMGAYLTHEELLPRWKFGKRGDDETGLE